GPQGFDGGAGAPAAAAPAPAGGGGIGGFNVPGTRNYNPALPATGGDAGYRGGGGPMMRFDEAPPSDPPGEPAFDTIANPSPNDMVTSGFLSMNRPEQADISAMTNEANMANVSDMAS